MYNIPDPNAIYANPYKTSCFIKNVVTAPNIHIGDYTHYDDPADPAAFEKNNILFNRPAFGDKLVIGKFCSIACGAKFIMGSAGHRIDGVTAYPFAVFGGAWEKKLPSHVSQIPFKGDTVVGNDVWIGRECVIMPGVKIGDGAILSAYSVVTEDVEPYGMVDGNPAQLTKKRFDDGLIELLLKVKWWDLPPRLLTELLPVLCGRDLEQTRTTLAAML